MGFRLAVKPHECPQCGSYLVRPTKTRTVVEDIVSMIFLGPYRCDDCDRRFFSFETRSVRKSSVFKEAVGRIG